MLDPLFRNAFVMEYIGEVITNSEFIRRTKVYEAEGLSHYYFMTLKTDEVSLFITFIHIGDKL